jgi:SH3 domain-containing kinase-binding protein 1
LKLAVGEIIYILDKNLEDEGWWKGESISTGRIGVFPDNFVEEIVEPSNPTPNVLIPKRSTGTIIQNNKISNNQTSNNNSNAINKSNINSNPNDQIPISSSSSSSTSSSSSSSAINSLSRQPDNKRQMNGYLVKNQNQSNDDIHSKSQSDISEDLDDIQSSDRNKLIHIKKTRQFNKRPPSFRNKQKDFENDPNFNNSTEKIIINNSNNYKDVSPPQNTSNAKKDSFSRQTTPISPKLSPSNTNELISNSVVSNITNASTVSLLEEISLLKQELDSVRKDSGQIQNDYKLVSGELSELRKNHDDQMKRMQKKLQDLISEIDEEKKTRLALQVELERLKKTIMNN